MNEHGKPASDGPDPLEQAMQRALSANPPSRESLLNELPESLRGDLLNFFNELDELDSFVLPDDGSADEERMEILAAAFRPAGADAVPRIGKYALGKPVAEPGGMSEVWETHLAEGTRAVLKLCRGSPVMMRQICDQVESIRKLAHPNIIRIYDHGWDEATGRFFYVMELMDRGDLAEHINVGEYRTDMREAARVMAETAKGVAEAHRHLIAHSDLKPRNILLAADGSVKIADFDLARRFVPTPNGVDELQAAESDDLRGTLRYYSPEEAKGQPVTRASEVYTLGAILYEMLTGEPLVQSRTPIKIIAEISDRPTPSIREKNPAVPVELERMCLACLAKKPEHRGYQSADEFAADLDNWQCDRPIGLPPENRRARIIWWIRRNPGTAVQLACLALSPLLVAVMLVKTDLDYEAALRTEVGRTNTYVAQQVGGSMLFQLGQYSTAVVETAQDAEFHEQWNRGDKAAIQKHLKFVLDRFNNDPRMRLAQRRVAPTFASLFALNSKGELVAIWPDDGKLKTLKFPDRDYFTGAMRHRERETSAAVHISRMFESEVDQLYKFAISVPFYARPDRNGPPDGVLAATLTTDSTLGLIQLHDERSKVALVLPFDGNAPDPPAVFHKILLHPAYSISGTAPVDFPTRPGRPMPKSTTGPELRVPQTEQEYEPDFNYEDPVGGDARKQAKEYRGRWIAGFAPVGNTEMLVVVQQRYADAVEKPRGWFWWSFAVIGAALVAAAILATAVALRLYRLTNRQRTVG